MPLYDAVKPEAIRLPGLNKLVGKRVILASGSPRRQEILKIFVRGSDFCS